MMLYVGQDTSLSLLLRAGCLQVTPIMATKDTSTQLIRPPLLPSARPVVADEKAPAAAAADDQDIKPCPIKCPKLEKNDGAFV
jgi:hypothetical protein